MAKRARPAQGNNSTPARSPRPAYRSDASPVTFNAGSVSRPKKNPWGRLKTLVTDATPKRVKL